ncbi:aldehyde dehydrogenase [Candidatus Rariloculus sp.]|uniref:aldehyde dehydrogenase n=1 Tax=Candidatus Rariloculus sp. TaxID=3101265 RepID=UPI003D113E78
MRICRMLIGGEWVDSRSGQTFESFNPFTGKPWALVPRATPEDVGAAVAAARAAFEDSSWRELSATDRGVLLGRVADLIAERADGLAELETRDNGKLITEMGAQLRYLPQWFRYYAGLADKLEGRVIPIDRPGMFNFTIEEPLGVVAALTPWNSPLMLGTWKLAPALAAGNTCVWKPSEHASVSALEFGKLFAEAGFPPGVVNIVSGFGNEIGDALVGHKDIAKVAFTGGDATGQRVYETAAKQIKPVTMELGGKSANIVFEDADLDNALKGVVSGIFAATGQTCVAGSRALIQRSILDEFVARFVELAKTARMGDPLDPNTQIGPITTRPQFAKILDYLEIARNEGAKCVLGGGPSERPECGDGWFIEPTIFVDVEPGMRIAQEEVFGPVLGIIPFEDDDEAVEIANGTVYGLAAGVWTADIGRCLTMARRLEVGTVWINTYRASSYMSPFGGYKRSGFGRESGLSAIREYVQEKSVWIDTSGETPNPFIQR